MDLPMEILLFFNIFNFIGNDVAITQTYCEFFYEVTHPLAIQSPFSNPIIFFYRIACLSQILSSFPNAIVMF
jgi:hypothetical protein